MKELFQKLSNLFNFGKENRLVNEGEAPHEAPVQDQKAEKVSVAPPSSSEEGVDVGMAEAAEAVEAGDSKLNRYGEKAYGADINVKDTPLITPTTPEEREMEAKISQRGLVRAIRKGVAGDIDISDIFSDKPTAVADAGGKKDIDFENMPPMDLSDKPAAAEGFEEGIDLSGKGEEGEGKPDETLMAAANKAGEEEAATGELEKGFDLSEEGEEEAKMAGGRVKKDTKTK